MGPEAVMEMDLYFAVMLMRGSEKLNQRTAKATERANQEIGDPGIRDLGGGRKAVRITDMGQLGAFVKSRGGGV